VHASSKSVFMILAISVTARMVKVQFVVPRKSAELVSDDILEARVTSYQLLRLSASRGPPSILRSLVLHQRMLVTVARLEVPICSFYQLRTKSGGIHTVVYSRPIMSQLHSRLTGQSRISVRKSALCRLKLISLVTLLLKFGERR